MIRDVSGSNESNESGDEDTFSYQTPSTRIETSSLLDSLNDVTRSQPLYRSVAVADRSIASHGLVFGQAHSGLPAEEELGVMPQFKSTQKARPVAPPVQVPRAPGLPNYPLSPNGMDVPVQSYPVILENLRQHLKAARLMDWEIDEAQGEVTGHYFSDRSITDCKYRINIYELPSGKGHKLEFTRVSNSTIAFHDFMRQAKAAITKASGEDDFMYGDCPPLPGFGGMAALPLGSALPTLDLPELDEDRFDFDQETLDGYSNTLKSGPFEAQVAILSILSQGTQSAPNARLISEHSQLPRLFLEHCQSTDCACARYAAISLKNIAKNGDGHACQKNLGETDLTSTLLACAQKCTSQEAALQTYNVVEALLEHKICDGRPRRHNASVCQDIMARNQQTPIQEVVDRVEAILTLG